MPVQVRSQNETTKVTFKIIYSLFSTDTYILLKTRPPRALHRNKIAVQLLTYRIYLFIYYSVSTTFYCQNLTARST